MADFERTIGVRYSGRKGPVDRLRQIQVYVAEGDAAPFVQTNPDDEEGRWSRRELAEWLQERLGERDEGGRPVPTVVGLDHAFSLPQSYMQRHGLKSWQEFLLDFEENVPTHEVSLLDLIPGTARTGDPDEHRLTGDWTAFPRAAFSFDLQDTPGRSAYAGIPWLSYLRRSGAHFWPFDGWQVDFGRSLVAEVRPARLRHRYPKAGAGAEEQDAYAICAWLQDRDRHHLLRPYFEPPLTDEEKERAKLEGWILGVW
jgi:hypothetical protein